MPKIRDGNNRVTEFEVEPPSGVGYGPIERSQVSAQRMADFAAERARAAEKASPAITHRESYSEGQARRGKALGEGRREAAASMAASRARGAVRGGFVKGQKKPAPPAHHDAGVNRVRQQAEAGRVAATAGAPTVKRRFPLPRDPAERRAAVLVALRSTHTVRAAAGLLGVTETRVGQILREIRLAGEMPADLDADIKSRSAIAAATRTGTVPLAAPLVDPAGKTAAEVRREQRAIADASEMHEPGNKTHTDSTLKDPEAGAPATAADDGGAAPPAAATEVAMPPGPTPDVVLPCEGCVHVEVCNIKALLEVQAGWWAERLTTGTLLHPAISVSAIAIRCTHELRATS